MGLPAGFALLMLAHATLWLRNDPFSNATWAAVIVPTLALGFWLDRRTPHQPEKTSILEVCLVAALLVSCYSLHRWGFALLPQGIYLTAAACEAPAGAGDPNAAAAHGAPGLRAAAAGLLGRAGPPDRTSAGPRRVRRVLRFGPRRAGGLRGAERRMAALPCPAQRILRPFAVSLHSAPAWVLAMLCVGQLAPREVWPLAFAAAGVVWLAPTRRAEFRALNGYGMLLLLIAGFLTIDGTTATGPIGLAQGLSVAGLALASVLLIHYWSVELPEPMPMLLETAGGLVCLAVSDMPSCATSARRPTRSAACGPPWRLRCS